MNDYDTEESELVAVEAEAQDDGDENADDLVGEEVEPEHDLNIDEFEVDDDDGEDEE